MTRTSPISHRTTRPVRSLSLGLALAAGLGLSACGSSPATTAPPEAAVVANASPSGSSGAAATVAVAKSGLGDVLVDAKGMTLYMYTKDTQSSGKSSCAGQCLAAWPPLVASGTPTADGVSGTLATIDTADGKKQVTLNGWPLYYYVKDTKAGDTTGQNVGKVWFVLDRSGTPLKEDKATTATTPATTGY